MHRAAFLLDLAPCGGAEAFDLEETSCGGAQRHAAPDDPAERGRWALGAGAHGIDVPPLVPNPAQDGCGATQLAPERGWRIVRAATAAGLEETLACSSSDPVAELREVIP